MDCVTCEQLTAECERAEKHYAVACGQLSVFSKTASAGTYRAVKEFTEEARLEYEVARIELERHQRTHAMVKG
jgi:hypothetical protein